MGQTRAYLRLLGDVAIFGGDGQPINAPSRAYILILYLFQKRENSASRQEIANFFWPGSEGALTNLRQLISLIKSSLGDIDLISTTATTLTVHLDKMQCDWLQVRRLIESPLDIDTATTLLDLYSDGLQIKPRMMPDEVTSWLAIQSQSLQETVAAAVADWLDHLTPEINPDVEAIANRLIGIDPHQEAAWRALLRIALNAGQVAKATTIYDQCCRALESLGAKPDQATRALFDRPRIVHAVPSTLERCFPKQNKSASLPRLVILPPEAKTPLVEMLLDDVVIKLCTLKSITLIAPHTAWGIQDKLTGNIDIFTAYDIDYIAEAASFHSDGHRTLTIKLFEARGRAILWAGAFQTAPNDLQRSYQEISASLSQILAEVIENAEIDRQKSAPGAYYYHLVGQRHLRKLNLPDVRRAAKAFRQSRASEPEFAPAYSGAARAHHREWLLLGRTETALLEQAREAGEVAVRLDPNDARGYRELGVCSLYMRHHDDSLEYYRQATLLSPSYADLLADYADALAHSGRPEDGIETINRALALNPLPPEQYWWDLAGMYYQTGKYRDAIDVIGRMTNNTAALRIAAASYAMIGDTNSAHNCAAAFLEAYPDFSVEKWLSLVPNKRVEDTKHYEAGLRSAGFKS